MKSEKRGLILLNSCFTHLTESLFFFFLQPVDWKQQNKCNIKTVHW